MGGVGGPGRPGPRATAITTSGSDVGAGRFWYGLGFG